MDYLDLLLGFLLGAGGYSLRLLQDWVAWRRGDVDQNRHRWKLPRMELLLAIGDCGMNIIARARTAKPHGASAWDDPEFAQEVTRLFDEWERLLRRAAMLVAHRDTLHHLKLTQHALYGCLPPRAANVAWDVDGLTRKAESALGGHTHLARTNELGLSPIGAIAGPEGGSSLVEKARFRLSLRRWEKRRG